MQNVKSTNVSVIFQKTNIPVLPFTPSRDVTRRSGRSTLLGPNYGTFSTQTIHCSLIKGWIRGKHHTTENLLSENPWKSIRIQFLGGSDRRLKAAVVGWGLLSAPGSSTLRSQCILFWIVDSSEKHRLSRMDSISLSTSEKQKQSYAS